MRKLMLYGVTALATITLCVVIIEARTRATAPPVSADVETTYLLPDGRQFGHGGHYYRSQNGQVREDSGLGAVITDTNKGTVTLLISASKEAHVFIVPAERRSPARQVANASSTFDHGMHDGHPVVKSHGGANGSGHEMWVATDIGLPVYSRVESRGLTTTTTLRNISMGEPDPSLFRIPDDYQTVVHEKAVPPPAGRGAAFPGGTAVPKGR